MNRSSSTKFFSGLILGSSILNILGIRTALATESTKSTIQTSQNIPNKGSCSVAFEKSELYKSIEKTISGEELGNLENEFKSNNTAESEGGLIEIFRDKSLKFLVASHKLFSTKLKTKETENLNKIIRRAWADKVKNCCQILKEISYFSRSNESLEELLLGALRLESKDLDELSFLEAYKVQKILYEVFGKAYVLRGDSYIDLAERLYYRYLAEFPNVKNTDSFKIFINLTTEEKKEILEIMLRSFLSYYNGGKLQNIKDSTAKIDGLLRKNKLSVRFDNLLERELNILCVLLSCYSNDLSRVFSEKLIVPFKEGNIGSVAKGIDWIEKKLDSLLENLGKGNLFEVIEGTISEKELDNLSDGFKKDNFGAKSEGELIEKLSSKSLRSLMIARKLSVNLKEEGKTKLNKVIESIWKDKVEKCRQILNEVSGFGGFKGSSQDLLLRALRLGDEDFDKLGIPEAFKVQNFLYEIFGKNYVLHKDNPDVSSSLHGFYTFTFSKIEGKKIDECLSPLSIDDRKEILEFMLRRLIPSYCVSIELLDFKSNNKFTDLFRIRLNSLYILSSRCSAVIPGNLYKKLIVPMNEEDKEGLAQGLKWFSENLDALLSDLENEKNVFFVKYGTKDYFNSSIENPSLKKYGDY